MHPLALLRPTAFLRRLGVQLAFVALLAAALMPTISRLAQPEGLADWAAICQSTPSGNSLSDAARAHDDACAFCTLAHTTPFLLGDATPTIAAIAFAPPAPRAPAPVRAHAAQARPPAARGPPVLV